MANKLIRREIHFNQKTSDAIDKAAKAANLFYGGKPNQKAWIENLIAEKLFQMEINFKTPENGTVSA